jgi:hypothetical protein
MGLPIAPHVRCLGINEQVAQKLHACTGPLREDRARDVLDILLVDMLGKLDYPRVRGTAERVFVERHARELGYPITNAEGIEAKFVAVVQAIATASAD